MTPDEFKVLRLKMGYKQQSLFAPVLGMSLSAVRSWEQGRRAVPPYIANFMRLLDLYGELLRKTEEMKHK